MEQELSLRSHGFGSYRWIESIFNFENERKNVLAILSQGVGPLPVIKYIEQQAYTLLTEYAVGTEALTVQPVTEYDVSMIDGKVKVFASSFTEFGEQLQGYLEFDKMPPAIGEGLKTAFTTLYQLRPGEGVVTYSPTELYRDQKSNSDVFNPKVVEAVIYDQEQNVVEVKVKGWFLFPNKKLSHRERELWLECHGLDSVEESDLIPENLVKEPHYWTSNSATINLENNAITDVSYHVYDYIEWINTVFIEHFGKPIFTKSKKEEDILRDGIYQKIKNNSQELFDRIVGDLKMSFYQLLWTLIHQGQETWAIRNNMNPNDYLRDLYLNRIVIAGFHPAADNDDFGNSDELFKTNESTGYCKIHGKYKGHRCPKCSNH